MRESLTGLPGGWLTDVEAAVLATHAEGRVVLEVGSFAGRSTVALARAARLVVAIDHHRGSPEHQPGGRAFVDGSLDRDGLVDSSFQFLQNLTDYGVREKVVPMIGRGLEVLPMLGASQFGLVFIDADHSEEATFQLGALAAPLVRDGWLLFHDCNELPVARAVARLAEILQLPIDELGGSIAGMRIP